MKKLFSMMITGALIISSISVSAFADELTPDELCVTDSITFSAEIETTAIPLSAENLKTDEQNLWCKQHRTRIGRND